MDLIFVPEKQTFISHFPDTQLGIKLADILDLMYNMESVTVFYCKVSPLMHVKWFIDR